MTTQELKEYINKVLGNSIRCLLPSYWWKKLFGLVVDEVDTVKKIANAKADKSYVDNAVANVEIDVDSYISSSSTNPVQNKVIYKELAKKQNTLVSGTDIKTINGNTLLGSGNVEIAEAPSVIVTDENFFDFFTSFGSDKSSKVRGFIVRSTDSEQCLAEIDNANAYRDSDGNVIWVIEYNYKDKRYRRLYNKTSESFIREEEIPLGDSSMSPIYVPVGYTLSEEEIAANITAYNEYHSETNKKLGYAIVRILHNDVSGSIPMSILNWYGDTFTIGDWDSDSNYDTFAYTLSSDGSVTYEGLRKADASLNTTSTQPVQNKVITAALNSKVDIVEGKQLSTEDFTTTLKTKLEGLSNYDDTEISEAVEGLQTEVDTLNETITTLQNEVIDNEEVTAASLNDINNRINQLGADSKVTYATKTELQEAVATINNTIVENEEITAAALNDLDARIKDLISRLEALTTQSSVLSGALEIDEDGDLHSTTGIYSDTFISARGKDSNV